MGCKNTQKKDIISLVPDSNFIVTSINTLDSIVISYESLFRDKCKVKRVFYYKSLLPITIEYNLIDKGSKVSLELQNPNERCDYLIFDKFKKSEIIFSNASEYFTGELHYIGKETFWNNDKNCIDSLSIFYGNDLGFDHWSDSLYFLFDNSLRLRKILSNKRSTMFIDKGLLKGTSVHTDMQNK